MDRHPPDIIVLDIMLPGEDGLNLARQLRAKSDVPILMLSARGEEIDRVEDLRLAPTITLPSPSARENCWRGCMPCCGVPGSWGKPGGTGRRGSNFVLLCWT